MTSSVEKSSRIEFAQNLAALLRFAHAVQSHGIEPLEYVALFAVTGRPAVLLHEPLDFLEACDDAFVLSGTSALLLFRGELGEFRCEIVKIEVSHNGPLS